MSSETPTTAAEQPTPTEQPTEQPAALSDEELDRVHRHNFLIEPQSDKQQEETAPFVPPEPPPLTSDSLIQFKTNNDGTLGNLQNARGPIDPQLAEKLKESVGEAVSDDNPDTTPGSAIEEVMSGEETAAFVSIEGTYYKAKVARHSGDSFLVSPSPALLGLLERYGETDIEVMNEKILRLSNALAGTGVIGQPGGALDMGEANSIVDLDKREYA